MRGLGLFNGESGGQIDRSLEALLPQQRGSEHPRSWVNDLQRNNLLLR